MPLVIIRRLVILLFLAALAPMQALASDTKAPGFFDEIAASSQLFDTESKPESEIPASTSFAMHNTLAIVQNQRSVFSPKQEIDGNELSRTPSNPNGFCCNFDTYAFNAKWQVNREAYDYNKGAYRLGGWKESNALYVALNGQFSS